MMRIYCDSNKFRKLKKTSRQFNDDLFKAIQSVKPYFIFLFSEAHLSDLSKSEENYRIEDLLLMGEYVNNNYLSRDHIEKEFHYYLATPTEAYNSWDFKAADDFLENPHESFYKMFDFEGGEDLKQMMKDLFDLPIFGSNEIDTSQLPDGYRELMEQFKGVKSINDALKNLNGANHLLDSKPLFKQHKKLLSSYINRDDYSYEKWSMDFDEKMENTAFGKSFSELVDMTIASSDKSDDYVNLINTYINLEFLGVTEERMGSSSKLKKNSHLDLNKDASHTYFASKADYFITDDVGVQTKAFITYKMFGIQTQVLSVDDFLQKSVMLIKNEDSLSSFSKGLSNSIKTGLIVNQSQIEGINLIETPYPILNYFNRIQTNSDKQLPDIQLFKSTKGSYGIMYAEIDLLVEKISSMFGFPDQLETAETLSDYRSDDDDKLIKSWTNQNLLVNLSWEGNTLGQQIVVMSIKILDV